MNKKRIHFGVMLQGAGCFMNSWRHPSVPVDASKNLDYYIERALKAEAAGIDYAFIADGLHINEKSFPHFLNRFEPIAILSALAVATSKIGLVGTVSTTYSDPFTVARQLGSVDALSGGRAGWNSVTSPLEGSGRNYSITHPPHAERYEIAAEHMEAVTALWDSWDDDAFIRDRETGQFFDVNKMHRANYKGKYFNVEGPLTIGRSPQGQPVIFQAGSSEAGIRQAARFADAVFTNGGTFEKAREFYKKVKDATAAAGRNPDHIKILPGLGPIVGRTDAEAEEKLKEIQNLITIENALDYLSHFFYGHDFRQYPLDEPFPDIGDAGKQGFQSTSNEIIQVSKERGLTLREVAMETPTLRVHIGTTEGFIGSAERVADEIIRWIDGGAADGFMLGLPVLGFGLDDFIDLVMPILVERGYHDMQQQGDTLRDHFGLPFRESMYATKTKPTAEQLKADDIELVIRTPDCADAKWCMDQYVEELDRTWPTGFDPKRSNPAPKDDLIPPKGYIVVALKGDQPVGCGILRLKDENTGEIKRMWTSADVRRRGVGRMILRKLEDLALEAGLTTLHLETNENAIEARGLYDAEGYKSVEPFNDEYYANFWYEKKFAAAQPSQSEQQMVSAE